MRRKEHRCSRITQLTPSTKVVVNNMKCGEVIKSVTNASCNYYANNSFYSSLFDQDAFFSSCQEIEWDSDIYPLIEMLDRKISNLLSCVVTINQVCNAYLFNVNNTQRKVESLYTTVDLRLTIKCTHGIINIKRTLFDRNVQDKDRLTTLIQKEIEKINQQFAHASLLFVTSDAHDCSIILPAGIGGIWVHEAIGHCLEADIWAKATNPIKKQFGKRITANSEISISDTCRKGDMIFYNTSDDGAQPVDVNLVHKGFLVGLLGDEFSEKSFGLRNTGNGRASDCNSIPIPRMRNTFIHNGTSCVDDIIRFTRRGLLATDIEGGNVNVQSGEFVFCIKNALFIDNGNIIGVAQPFLFSDNITTALDSIDAIGNDLDFTYATCGKYGQLVEVSYGQPTIRIDKCTRRRI